LEDISIAVDKVVGSEKLYEATMLTDEQWRYFNTLFAESSKNHKNTSIINLSATFSNCFFVVLIFPIYGVYFPENAFYIEFSYYLQIKFI